VIRRPGRRGGRPFGRWGLPWCRQDDTGRRRILRGALDMRIRWPRPAIHLIRLRDRRTGSERHGSYREPERDGRPQPACRGGV